MPEINTVADIHALRKQIDAVINASKNHQTAIGRNAGGREISLAVTKLQEAKMWCGKILEELGSELPKEFQDKAE
jgi:hypothetical protein